MRTKKLIFKEGLKLADNKVVIGELIDENFSFEGKHTRPIIKKAEEEAERLVAKAIEEASRIRAKAEADQNSVRDAAHKEGYEHGLETGHKEAKERAEAEMSSILLDSSNILEAIEKERRECLEDEENRLMSFITLLVRKLIYRDLSFEPSKVLELIKMSIKELNNKAEVEIIINPKTAKKLDEIKNKIIENTPGMQKLSITGDSVLGKGDFILKSNKERLDLRLDSQIENLLDILFNAENKILDLPENNLNPELGAIKTKEN